MSKFKFDQHFQTHYLAHYVRNPRFFAQVHADVKPEFFSAEHAQSVVRLVQSFAQTSPSAPGTLIYTELDNLNKIAKVSAADTALQRRFIDSLFDIELGNMDYLLKEHKQFVRYAKLVDAVPIISQAIDAGDLEMAEHVLTQFSRDTSEFSDLGVYLSEDPTDRIARRLSDDSERFFMGIPELDRELNGLKRRQLGVLLSQRSSAGKTACLIYLAKFYVLCGRSVLVLTLEDTREDFEDKLDMCVAGIGTDQLEDSYAINQAMRQWFFQGGRIHVAEFPPCKVSQLRAYTNWLRQTDAFSPDVILLDYADLCEPEDRRLIGDSYATGDQVYKSLTKWAKEDDLLIWTASQAGRAAMEAVHADQQHAAGSIAKMYHAHLVISINRTSAQQEEGLTDLHVVKNKNGKARFTKTIHSDFDRMAFRVAPPRE